MNGYRTCWPLIYDKSLTSHSSVEDARRRRQNILGRAVKRKAANKLTLRTGGHTPHFPIDQLPLEVLIQVFIQCLPEIKRWPILESRSTKDVAPLLLCNVCSSWRQLALSTPHLWQRLFLEFTDILPKAKGDEVVGFTHMWIRRACELPLTLGLHIEVELLAVDLDESQAMVDVLLGALLHYSSRWEHVQFRIFSFHDITFPQLGHTPCLRSFRMRRTYFWESEIPLSSCPTLTEISWPFEYSISSTPILPWHQLTRIIFGATLSSLETLNVIRSCPKLTDLRLLTGAFDDPDEPLPDEVAVNDSLQTLYLGVSLICDELLKRLTLPALTDVTVDFKNVSSSAGLTRKVHKGLLSFFTRSKCKLDRLQFLCCSFDHATLLECLQLDSCTSLTSLKISCARHIPMLTDPILVALTHSNFLSVDRDMLLPNLSCLSLERCFGGSPGILGRMILSRCMGKEDRLQNLDIRFLDLEECGMLLIGQGMILGLKINGTDLATKMLALSAHT
jgi:hypothetical protein